MTSGVKSAALAAAAWCLAGCATGLTLTRLEATARPPGNVALFFAVDRGHGQPIADLRANDFNIYEDGQRVSLDASRQTLVNPQIAAVHYTLLLIDMSSSVTASEQIAAVTAAAGEFVTQVEHYQRVGVYAFDGSKNLYEIVPFTPTGSQAPQRFHALAAFQSHDPSTNLHGAVIQALAELDKAVHSSDLPLRFGSLVVFTDGIDRANRVPFQQMVDAVEGSRYHVYALGIGREIDDSSLARIGKTGYVRVDDGSASRDAFREIANRIVGYTRRYYLLSYCSPARAGKHTLSVEAVSNRERGRLDFGFDAAGFGPSCDPLRPPSFPKN